MAEAVGVVLGVAQTLLATLDNQKLKQIWSSIVGSESQLEKLRDTVTTIKAVLLDAAYRHRQLNEQEKVLVEKLKDAVYDADDLFDEYATVSLQLNSLPGGKLSKKVRQFFSDKNQLLLGQKMSSEIKKLREKLDNIAKDSADFGFNLVHKPVIKRPETSSYVYESNVIGREVEKKSMIDLMLSDSEDVSFVTIMGMGGLGKTTLAQLVYNDDMIKRAFPLRLWVCVSEDFGMKQILSKMLQLATKVDHGDLLLDVLQEKVKQHIQGGRYLLVLDDVWEESHRKWQELKEFLVSGARGSRILITTRSKQVGMAVDKDMMHQLEGLSEEDSWNLFKNIALEQANTDLEEIGRNIVKKCVNVPLSIKVIASLLHGQDKTQWLMFGKLNLLEMTRRDEDSIMPTLMFSYHHLTPELKSCFSFCSLFPKDYVFSKWQLISLWMAQGFVAPLEGQSMEDMGEIYFSTLMNRCFFQDIKTDEHGDVKTCKMHDLVHDLAKEVAGKELFIKENTNPIERKIIRHLSTRNYACFDNYGSCMYKLRTYLWFGTSYWGSRIDDVDKILSYGRCSRVLDLRKLSITIPNTLGKLSHLRYLDLSQNLALDKLPKSITKLHNLQILILKGCVNLTELPEDTSKLVNLKCLDVDGCYKLSHMPRGMDKLTCLHRLTRYVVGGDDCKHVKKGELADLKHLVNLRGELCIKVGRCFSNKMPNVPRGSSSSRSAQLKVLKIHIQVYELKRDESGAHETLLEGLPNNNDLRIFEMKGYQGRIFPSWASPMSTSLPQLVSITLRECGGLKHLSSLGQLVHLKILIVDELPNVEYMDGDLPSPLTPFLPCLEELELMGMPKLKGWWRDLRWKESEAGVGCLVDGNGFHQLENLPLFPRLRKLKIKYCKSMTYIPPCPHVKELTLFNVNEEVTFCMKGGILPVSSASSLSTTLSSDLQLVCSTRESENCILYLKELEINNFRVLNAIYREFVGGAGSITLYLSGDREKIWSFSEAFQRCASSLRCLMIFDWKSMEGGGLEHLTNLQSLKISHCSQLDLEEEDDKGRIPWKSLHSLSSLRLWKLPKLVKLPKGLRYLTSLQSLDIMDCSNLEALGECIGFLTSLQSLQIIDCIKLTGLSECITSLTSLKSIVIMKCPNMKSLPEAMHQLTSLTKLSLDGVSHELKQKYQETNGQDLCHIPHLLIEHGDSVVTSNTQTHNEV